MLAWSRCERKFGPLIAERSAGAISAGAAAVLERHLRRCDRCRSWEAELRELVEGMRQASRVGALAHPSPQELAALSAGGAALPAGQAAGIERHLASCPDCRAEWSVATRWSPVRLPAPASSARFPGARWGWFAAGVGSAAAAAAALFAVLLPGPGSAPLGLRPVLEAAGAPVQVRGAHHRAAADATPLVVPPGAGVVLVGLTVEARPRSPLEIEMRDEAGELLARAELSLEDASGLVLFSVTATRLPPRAGEFRVRVADTGESFRYPFRVERRGD